MGDISPISRRLGPIASPQRVRKYDGRREDEEEHRRKKPQPDANATTGAPSESDDTENREPHQRDHSRGRSSETDDQPGRHIDVRV